MKKIISILLSILVLSNVLPAQNINSKTYDMSSDSKIVKNNNVEERFFTTDVSERIITTSVIIGEAIILLLVLFYWKRTRNDSKTEVDYSYKRNIRAIRDERIKPIPNLEITSKRKHLRKRIKTKALNGRTITSTAKKLSIAKGEVFLATRIQQLQNQTR